MTPTLPPPETVMWWVRFLLLAGTALVMVDAAWDKLTGWRGLSNMVREKFKPTPLGPLAIPMLALLSAMMVLGAVACVGGLVQLLLRTPAWLGFWGAVLACLTFLALIFGLQVSKDHATAKGVIPYFLVSILTLWSFAV